MGRRSAGPTRKSTRRRDRDRLDPSCPSVALVRAAEVLALIFSVVAVIVAPASARYTQQQAAAARAADHRARAPKLKVTLAKGPRVDLSVAYEVLNTGPQDLDSIVVHQPESNDPSVRYPVAGEDVRFGAEAELGRVRMARRVTFYQTVGFRSDVPDFGS
jgi:hypothetical protein